MHLDPTLKFETHFQNIYKKAAGRVHLLLHISSRIDTFTALRAYQSMIMPIFMYCGHTSLGWSGPRKCMICSIESQSLKIISPKCSPQNCNLWYLPVAINDFLQKTYCFVFDYLNGSACFPLKDYFHLLHHKDLNENDQFFKFTKHVSTELLSSSVEWFTKQVE